MNGSIFKLLIFLITLIKIVLAGYSPSACPAINNRTQGFTAQFYYYPYGNLRYSHSTEFLSGGYLSILKPGPTVTGVTNPFFSQFGGPIPFYPEFSATNFSVALSGYYVAPQTGLYRFSYQVDDAGIIFVGAGTAFDCCAHSSDFFGTNATFINQYDAQSPTIRELYLEAGRSYPIKIYFINALLIAKNQLTVILPDGTKDTNIGTSVYSGFDNSSDNCEPISITYSFTTSTSFTTFTSISSVSTLKSLKSRTTYATTVTTSYLDDDHPVIKEIILVATHLQ